MAELAPEQPLPITISGLSPDPLTYRDLYRIDDDFHRYEVLEGALVVSPFPKYRHQYVRDELRRLFWEKGPADVEVNTDVTVRLHEDENGLVPDLVVVAPDVDIEKIEHLEAEQVLAVAEVVSPGSANQDRKVKPIVYAEHGIPCYWRIEIEAFRGRRPGERLPVVFIYELDEEGDCYRLAQRIAAGEVARVRLPFPMEFDPADLLPRAKK